MNSLTFNGIRKDYLVVLRGKKVPLWTEMNHNMISVPGMVGAHYAGTQAHPKKIQIPILIESKNFAELEYMKEDLAEWLITDEPKPLVLDSDPTRTYYAILDGETDIESFIRVGLGYLNFICPDPHKYGRDIELNISDETLIYNEGTSEADPVFELTATKKATFAMVSRGDNEEYNLIGTPANDDVEIIDQKVRIYEIGENMDGWNYQGVVNDSRFPIVDGTMQHDGTGIRALNYGSGSKIHGPGVIRELDETLQNFEIHSIFDVISDREIENFRIEIGLFDENMNNIGMLGVKDNSAHKKLRVGLGRVGPYRGGGQANGYLIGESNYTHEFGNNASLQMRFIRDGNKFTITVGRWYVRRLIETLTETYYDLDNKYLGKLKYIQVMIGTYGDRVKPSRLRINKLDVYKLNSVEVDQTPYILYPGDVITFDHKTNDILVNGEPRMDLKNFGGTFFKLRKGGNSIIISPENTFESNVSYTNKYL